MSKKAKNGKNQGRGNNGRPKNGGGNGRKGAPDVVIDVPGATRAAISRRVRFDQLKLGCACVGGGWWVISMFVRRYMKKLSLDIFLECLPVAFGLLLWGMKLCENRLITREGFSYCFTLGIYIVQTFLCACSLIGSVRIVVGDKIEDICYLVLSVLALLFWEVGIVYANDFGLADMLLALILTKLNINLDYLIGITFLFYFTRKAIISKMERFENEVRNEMSTSATANNLRQLQECWTATNKLLQSENSQSDLERKYPQFIKMQKLLQSE